jgi:hypothetical protein
MRRGKPEPSVWRLSRMLGSIRPERLLSLPLKGERRRLAASRRHAAPDEPKGKPTMLRVTFKNEKVLVAFGSMAEGMADVHADDDDTFEADQLNDLVSSVWNEAEPQADGTIIVEVHAEGAFQDVLENLRENEASIERDQEGYEGLKSDDIVF